jgi:TatD DNase family protein
VEAIVSVGENLADAARNLKLARDHPLMRPTAGLYPTELDADSAGELVDFIRTHQKVLFAIGEVGLDYWKVQAEEDRERQRRNFSLFIDLAKETALPLNVHSRSAGRHVVSLLLEKEARKVQLHAFDGKASSAAPAVEAGYFFSVPPSIVRSRQKQRLVASLPLGCLLLESDSPVLGVTPGERNEPAGVLDALHAIADIKKVSPDQAAEVIWENTLSLYGSRILD